MSRNEMLREFIKDYKKHIIDGNELMIEMCENYIEFLLSLNSN